jgi:hypothetical protein
VILAQPCPNPTSMHRGFIDYRLSPVTKDLDGKHSFWE